MNRLILHLKVCTPEKEEEIRQKISKTYQLERPFKNINRTECTDIIKALGCYLNTDKVFKELSKKTIVFLN